MFFLNLTKKTIAKRKIELKYKLFFWNKLYGLLDEQITHKLDYIPETWIVMHFSSLHSSMVYDTQAFAEPLYMNAQETPLQIQQISLDYTEFPLKKRNLNFVIREYSRIQLSRRAQWVYNGGKKGIVFTIQIPNYNIFLATNLVFLMRKRVRRSKKRN